MAATLHLAREPVSVALVIPMIAWEKTPGSMLYSDLESNLSDRYPLHSRRPCRAHPCTMDTAGLTAIEWISEFVCVCVCVCVANAWESDADRMMKHSVDSRVKWVFDKAGYLEQIPIIPLDRHILSQTLTTSQNCAPYTSDPHINRYSGQLTHIHRHQESQLHAFV